MCLKCVSCAICMSRAVTAVSVTCVCDCAFYAWFYGSRRCRRSVAWSVLCLTVRSRAVRCGRVESEHYLASRGKL